MEFEGYKTTIEPTVEPVTAAELGAQLRLGADEITAQTSMLEGLITACRRAIERVTWHSFVNRTIAQTYKGFNAPLELLYPPLGSVTKVEYYDSDNTLQTLANTVYLVDNYSRPGNITLAPNQSWPSVQCRTNAVIVTYVAGYGAQASDAPQEAKQLIIALAVDCYEHPELSPEVSLSDNPTYKFLLSSLMITDFF